MKDQVLSVVGSHEYLLVDGAQYDIYFNMQTGELKQYDTMIEGRVVVLQDLRHQKELLEQPKGIPYEFRTVHAATYGEIYNEGSTSNRLAGVAEKEDGTFFSLRTEDILDLVKEKSLSARLINGQGCLVSNIDGLTIGEGDDAKVYNKGDVVAHVWTQREVTQRYEPQYSPLQSVSYTVVDGNGNQRYDNVGDGDAEYLEYADKSLQYVSRDFSLPAQSGESDSFTVEFTLDAMDTGTGPKTEADESRRLYYTFYYNPEEDYFLPNDLPAKK